MLAKIKHLFDESDMFGTRSQRKCLKTTLTRILAISGIMLVVLMMVIVYYIIVLDRLEKFHQLETLNSRHQNKLQNNKFFPHKRHKSPDIDILRVNGPTSEDDAAIQPLSDYDQSLDVKHLRAKILHRRHARFVPDMLDPVLLQREPNFDSLYAKVRNKRTRLELHKLEKEYFRCKKESINSSGCMVAFAKLYSLAKEISEKMDKMKDIFNDNDEVLASTSQESNESQKKGDGESTKNEEKDGDQAQVSSTTDTSFSAVVVEAGDVKPKNSSGEDEHIHYSWIIDGREDGLQTTVNSDVLSPGTIVFGTATETGGTKATAMTEIMHVTESLIPKLIKEMGSLSSASTTYKPTNVSILLITDASVEPTQTEIAESHNDKNITHTQIESHKISWILDGFESDDQATKPSDRAPTPAPTAESSQTVESKATKATEQTQTEIDEKPEKISWIIDGHHEEDDRKKEEKLVQTTPSALVKDFASSDTEKISWILDEHENEEETTGKPTEKPEQGEREKDIPERISWIIDGNDSEDPITAPIRITPTPARDVFEELEFVTESVDKDEDKLRKLKYDTIAAEDADPVIGEHERIASTTIRAESHSTPYLVMNRTVTLANVTDVTITYGGDCVTTTPQPTETAERRASLDAKGTESGHPLDSPTSAENMLESLERRDEYRPINESSTTMGTIQNASTPSAYDPKLWEDLFRKGSVVQQGELIDTFEAVDVESVLKNGAKLNSANIDSFQDTQFLSLCEQVAKRLRNKAGSKDPSGVTPASSSPFTSRGPGGFPVTGETMKASAQFLYNPNFGMPTIPICFYITPANFRMVNQSPMWTQGFQNNMQQSYMSAPMGFNMPNGVFFVPQNFGPTGGFFSQTGATGAGSQSNMANLFPKNASPQKQQQQFFCTYMQNNASNNNKMNNAAVMAGLGGGAMNAMSFSNANFKMRSNAQNLSTDIIYASYTNIPAHLGHADHYKCESGDEVGCYSGKECIRKSSWCDGFVDCADASDEAACRCIDRLPRDRVCDGYADCPMGEDELGCFGCTDATYSCYDGPEEFATFHRSTVSMCYSAIEKCDGIMNCLNGRDELECNIIVKNVDDHMSHAVSSSSGFLFHNHRGEWYPVCNNAEKWANEACANEAEQTNAKPIISFRAIILTGPFIEPTHVGQVNFPQACHRRDARDKLVDQAAYVKCPLMACGRVKKKMRTPFRQKRSRALPVESRKSSEDMEKSDVFASRIVGGSYSAPMQWPFVVAVYRDGKFHCGGTIYSENWILSAAHCVINYPKYHYEIRAGTLRRSSYASSAQIRTVTHIIAHQSYERRSMRNDLSLLQMNEPLMFNRWVKPICLPDMGRSTAGKDWLWGPKENTLCTAVGWGAVREKGPGSDQLREVVVPIRRQCTELEDRRSENVCAGDVSGGRDACQGDSGGPLFCRSVNNTEEWYLAGIVSHGNGCARPNEVGAYTRVALYLDWIEMAVKFESRVQPRTVCPGYTCVWGGKRCIPQKRRCDRIVDCLGGEDEVGCIYNFIPDMVGSSLNMTTTTESDYYPETLVTPPPCMSSEAAREERMRTGEIDGQRSMTGAGATVKNQGTEAQEDASEIIGTSTPGNVTITEGNTMTSSFTETNAKSPSSNAEARTKEIITETNTTELASTEASSTGSSTSTISTTETQISETGTLTASTSTEPSTAITSVESTIGMNAESSRTPQTTRATYENTTLFSSSATDPAIMGVATETPLSLEKEVEITTESPFLVEVTTETQLAIEITTESPSSVDVTTETQLTLETATEITTETQLSMEATTISPKKFDAENLITTASIESAISITPEPITTTPSEIARTEETTIEPVTVKQRKFNISTIPGKFVCQRIPQIVELSNRCDRILDCEDGTDEEACSCRDFLKGTLNILICDGKSDCEDLTDEENCGNCSADEFLCPLSKKCLPLDKRCDGTIDCDFKEDEKDCFALTNGRDIILDADKRPTLNSVGIFTRNSNGKWRVVCTHEIPNSDEIASTATNVCYTLGFKSLRFYNRTQFMTHDTIVPIHPDIRKLKKNIHSHLSSITADNHHFANAQHKFHAKNHGRKAAARTLYIERISDECTGLFVECEAKANNVEPLKTISAGDQLTLDDGSSTALQPALETHKKPNVFVTPSFSSVTLLKKKDEILNKMQSVIESRKNISLLIDNKLHEAVEDMHWPWIVDVYVDGRLWCLGALVDRYWVLVHESCQFGVRFNINFISVLLGGGKTKRLRHRSVHEQIRRVDCFERVPKSDVLLYHLNKPVHFTYHVLPTFLPDFSTQTAESAQQCIAILHDDNSGRIKTVSAIDERNDSLCKLSDMSCYRLVERKPPQELLSELEVSDEDFINLSEESVLKDALEDDYDEDAFTSAISRFTTCTQFGKKNISQNALEPIDQGILACRQRHTGWYPMALFDYNNTNCDSFKDAIALRTLENVYSTIQGLIDKPKCSEHLNEAPPCSTFRCTLGDCLDESKICNDISDCHDGADEETKMCNGLKKVCQPSELKCRTSYKCVPKTKFCDHIADCDDMTDEPTLCSCYTYLQATDPKKICDGIRNCWDKSDESPALCNCTANHFRCGVSSTECVPRDFVCDKEPDCPNGEDERYCIGIEFPQQTITAKAGFRKAPQLPKQPPQYGQVIEQTYGVWHTKCFPRTNQPDVHEVRQICKQLGFSPFKQPSYRIIDDATMEVVETNEWPDQRGRSFGHEEDSALMGRYRSATKAVVVSKFSPLSLNDELTLFLKPSRPIAEVARWNRTDSENCYRLEIKCM